MSTRTITTFSRCSPARERRALRRLLPLLLVAVAAAFPLLAQPVADDRTEITPDPAVQSAVARAAATQDPTERRAQIEKLIESAATAPAEFARQLIYFTSRARDTKDAMAAAAILRRAEIPEAALVRALVPCLDSEDPAIAKTVKGALAGLEKRAAGRRPDFSPYRDFIEERLRAGQPLPPGLIRYMYDEDAGMALLALLRAHQLRKPDEIKPILWAEHEVSDVLWKQQYGFLKPREVEPSAVEELAALAQHQAWWVRLYAAEIMRRHAEFRHADSITALTRDPNELVRESAARCAP